MISMSIKDSSRRRSGNQTVLFWAPQAVCAALRLVAPDVFPSLQAKNCGEPLFVYGTPFEPGGVIPPWPVQYGTLAWR